MGRRHGGAKDLPTGRDREREGNLGSGGAVGPEPLKETAGCALPSDSVRPLVHVRTRWPNENGEVREIPAALRNTACCLLGSTGEWLKVGEVEYPVAMNRTRSHMTGVKD